MFIFEHTLMQDISLCLLESTVEIHDAVIIVLYVVGESELRLSSCELWEMIVAVNALRPYELVILESGTDLHI